MADPIFPPEFSQYERPGKIVTLGHYYPQGRRGAAREVVRERQAPYGERARMRENLDWTRLVNALNQDRKWALRELEARLAPMLTPGLALAAVPPHIAFQAFWPLRTLIQSLAVEGRIDAAGCLVRHTAIRRILYGGPSTRALHRATIRIESPELVNGRRVLLLDDIAKSGASLMACRDLLLESGAESVQALALARVIVGTG